MLLFSAARGGIRQTRAACRTSWGSMLFISSRIESVESGSAMRAATVTARFETTCYEFILRKAWAKYVCLDWVGATL
eukprot:6871110-Prymnesium_polylepis.1